jgi:hypothetical protein
MIGMEARFLRCAVAIGSLVPICAGAAGVLLGPEMLRSVAASPDLDSHFRYLSGLLLAIGIGFATTIPRIEARGERFLLLTLLVVAGGIARLVSLAAAGPPSTAMTAALIMELGVTPALACWRHRVATAVRTERGPFRKIGPSFTPG